MHLDKNKEWLFRLALQKKSKIPEGINRATACLIPSGMEALHFECQYYASKFH